MLMPVFYLNTAKAPFVEKLTAGPFKVKWADLPMTPNLVSWPHEHPVTVCCAVQQNVDASGLHDDPDSPGVVHGPVYLFAGTTSALDVIVFEQIVAAYELGFRRGSEAAP